MNKEKQAIEVLKQSVKSNAAHNAVLHMWALRQRARFQVTLAALKQKMKAEGFDFPDAEYAALLRIMAQLGLGTIVADKRGKVTALKDIRITLQSLGQAVIGNSAKLESYRQRTSYIELPKPVDKSGTETPPTVKLTAFETPVIVTFIVNGKPVNVSFPKEANAEDIGTVVERFQRAREHGGKV